MRDRGLKKSILTFDQPDYADLYKNYFQCPIKFTQVQNKIIFPSRYLDKTFSSFNKQIFKLTETECGSILNKLQHTTGLTSQIRSLLARSAGQFPDNKQICAHFEISPATLRRRLAKEGTSYKQLLKEFRLRTCLHISL